MISTAVEINCKIIINYKRKKIIKIKRINSSILVSRNRGSGNGLIELINLCERLGHKGLRIGLFGFNGRILRDIRNGLIELVNAFKGLGHGCLHVRGNEGDIHGGVSPDGRTDWGIT